MILQVSSTIQTLDCDLPTIHTFIRKIPVTLSIKSVENAINIALDLYACAPFWQLATAEKSLTLDPE